MTRAVKIALASATPAVSHITSAIALGLRVVHPSVVIRPVSRR